jgi:cobalamin biosynthesis Co2+ chelatase CbiK
MGKKTVLTMLERAAMAFEASDFAAALRLYGEVLREFPQLSEAKIGVVLSDLAMHYPTEASALFDFYHTVKNEKGADIMIEALADAVMQTDVSAYDTVAAESIEYTDGIRYSDFIRLVDESGSFKETFDAISFSTKVVITSKAEFIDFVTRLAHEGMIDTALRYLDASGALFGNDQEVLSLYGMIEGEAR